MSTPRNDGGPAFPVQESIMSGGSPVPAAPDMSLRDWFAGQALEYCLRDRCGAAFSEVAKDAYYVADAMLKARDRQ